MTLREGKKRATVQSPKKTSSQNLVELLPESARQFPLPQDPQCCR